MGSSATATRKELAFCVVWSPLPPITWLFPFIGHLGIADSKGIASDFRGPYFVGDDGRMAFGAPTRALFIPQEDAEKWDTAIQEANEIYRGRMHNICCDNCHSHVACALNRMRCRAYGIENWNMVKLAALVFFKGRFLSKSAVYAQFGPFLVLVLVIVLSTVLNKRK
jgi:transmembrane protein 222